MWSADIANIPEREYQLSIQISDDRRIVMTIYRNDHNQLVVSIDAPPGPAEIPADWLRMILESAEKDLPAASR